MGKDNDDTNIARRDPTENVEGGEDTRRRGSQARRMGAEHAPSDAVPNVVDRGRRKDADDAEELRRRRDADDPAGVTHRRGR